MSYDITRLTPGGVEVLHHDEILETDGPFLLLHTREGLRHIIPAHALVSVDPCQGRCRDGNV